MTTLMNNQILKLILAITSLGFLAGCGSSETPRNSSYPTSTLTTDLASRTTSTDVLYTNCNHFDSSDLRLSGKLTSYYDASNELHEDMLRLRFTALTDQFTNSNEVKIQLFRWKADSDGTVDIDQTPLDFYFENASPSYFSSAIISDPMNLLTIDKVMNIRTTASLTGTTTQSFFDKTTMIIKGVDYNWDALKIVVYKNNEVIGQTDVLMPTFAVNPNVYAGDHASVLASLHPFWSQRTSSSTDDQLASSAKTFCF